MSEKKVDIEAIIEMVKKGRILERLQKIKELIS